MPGHEAKSGRLGHRAPTAADRRRRRLLGAVARGAGAATAAWSLAAPSAAQSPFTQPPSRTGTFTLPSSPSPASPFARPSPARPPARGPTSARPAPSAAQSPFTQPPSRSGIFTLPAPPPSPGGEGMPTGPRDAAAIGAPPAPLRPLPGGMAPEMPLPLPDEGEGAPPTPARLPPKPEVAPPLDATPTAPAPRADPVVLRAGLSVTLRVCQLLPADGLSPGERLLNSRPPIQPGDCFLAEVIDPSPPYPILVGGTVKAINGPGRFGRPGYVTLQMTQLVQTAEGRTGWVPWRMDTADRRLATRMRRVLLSTLLGLEGAGTGASVGAQFSGGNMSFIGGGMGVGALVGLGYATFQRGTEANLEPGDTFRIVVGTTHFRPIAREWQTILYPAADPVGGKEKAR